MPVSGIIYMVLLVKMVQNHEGASFNLNTKTNTIGYYNNNNNNTK